jgi:hypothetical protein
MFEVTMVITCRYENLQIVHSKTYLVGRFLPLHHPRSASLNFRNKAEHREAQAAATQTTHYHL